ncbi:uncharacterized protein K460DRAFT_275313 [Cucurbitaria berberidis CBS 394.84]|uniref:Transcription factor IIIC 90kDa subunit N-terminal domain-containing protein n=1 Tax=Cucurbitaria berberidis CBS 394.84 TaxID=1168544 RepID=A0A9P4GNE2_9PLEO|nr:uncharacterized protein K460DRAFT_275313 [Cucurbitaria berberidis CBS 394.84]KAF1848382.1 hypothetical protein K460DRAFT_275313 [Cucurbitaria berberidis CBS 394.84]
MTDVTELRCWPSCVDAVDWSHDGIIALASDERVELFFPNTVSFDGDQDVPQWQHVPLKVPLFSYDELPVKEPAPLPTYSLGEEISSSVPIAIAWSPPGLAKHRRCALATLTANLVLSLWSTESKPQEESSWSRRLIVNNALADYFLNNVADEPSHLGSGLGEQMRLRTRIRAFAWAPALPSSEANGIVGTRLSYGQHIVAVSNDDNQVAFAVIDSPTSTLGVDKSWSAEVLTHFSLTPDSESIFSEPIVFEDIIKQQRHVSHVAWSPWIIRGEWYHAVVVYATNEDVRARIITYTHDSIGLGDEVVYPDIQLRYNGPMKWSPRVEEGNKLKLALFANSGLVHLTISAHDASIIDQITHDLDGRQDQISGAIWDSAQHPTLRLHFSSLLSTLEKPTAVVEASFDGLENLTSPNWRDQIENNLVLFSVKNDLKGNSKAKVWGLTTSPLGDFIVACSSVHPSDMIEYGPPADRRGTIAISVLRQYSQLRKAFPARNVSAEGILYTLKKLAENTVEDAAQMPAFAEEIVDKLMQAYSSSPGSISGKGNSTAYPDSSNLDALVEALKKAAFLDPNTLRDRYTILASQACKVTSSNNNLLKTLIAYRLATALQDLSSSLVQTSFSTEIISQHQQLMCLVHTLAEPDKLEAEPFMNRVNGANNGSSGYPSVVMDDAIARIEPAASGVDRCDFCFAPIPFTDLTTCTCTNGHEFPRCGLSFLAIQAPGVTKYCGICSTPFLNEDFVMAQEVGVREHDLEKGGFTAVKHVVQEGNMATESEKRELPVTLARVLFLACDVCIYCGGKFVG